jgi:hypothetical protein
VQGFVAIGFSVLLLSSIFSGVVFAQPNSMVETVSNSQPPNTITSLPESKDHSTEDFFPQIRSQGDKGSCSAWAMVYYSLGYREAVNRGWSDAHTGEETQLLSPEFSFNIGNGGRIDEFGKPYGVTRAGIGTIITDWGTPTWSTMPYNENNFLDWGSKSAWEEAPVHRADFIKNIPYDENNPDEIITKIKQELVDGYLPTFNINAFAYTSTNAHHLDNNIYSVS